MKEKCCATHDKVRIALLSLLDILQELKLENATADGGHDDREGQHEGGTTVIDTPGCGSLKTPHALLDDLRAAGEHAMAASRQEYIEFRDELYELDKTLFNLVHAMRGLGSSIGLIYSANKLRESLANILILFILNFNSGADMQGIDIYDVARKADNIRKEISSSSQPLDIKVVDGSDGAFLFRFSEHMECLASDLDRFSSSLQSYFRFASAITNEELKNSLLSNVSSLRDETLYWTTHLKSHNKEFYSLNNMRPFFDKIMGEIKVTIKPMNKDISVFTEIGIPVIKQNQDRVVSTSVQFITAATFFSSVTASTLQYSYSMNGTLAYFVNAFWFSSLALSIASVVCGLFHYIWNQSSHSPGYRVPPLVSVLVERSSLVFLIISIVTFSFGLCFFAFSLERQPVASALTVAIISGYLCSLIFVATYFFSQGDIHSSIPISNWFRSVAAGATSSKDRAHESLEAAALPTFVHTSNNRMLREPRETLNILANYLRKATALKKRVDNGDTEDSTLNTTLEPLLTARDYIFSFRGSLKIDFSRRVEALWRTTETLKVIEFKLDTFTSSHLRSVDFSPNGDLLAITSGIDGCTVYDMTRSDFPRRLRLSASISLYILKWSPNSRYLLARSYGEIIVWDIGNCIASQVVCDLRSKRYMEDVAWLKDSLAFIAISDKEELIKFNTLGHVIDKFQLPYSLVGNITSLPGTRNSKEDRIICRAKRFNVNDVGDHLIFVYNLERREIEDEIPITGKVMHITISRDGRSVLVNFLDSGVQLWNVQWFRSTAEIPSSCFAGDNDEFVLGLGQNTSFKDISFKDGVHIWDRDSGALLKFLPLHTDGVFDIVRWSRTPTSPFTLLVGGADGMHVWYAESPRQDAYSAGEVE